MNVGWTCRFLCNVYIQLPWLFFVLLQLSQSWLVGILSFWFLCPFDMTIKCFFAFWDKKKAFLPSGTVSLSSLELISIFLWWLIYSLIFVFILLFQLCIIILLQEKNQRLTAITYFLSNIEPTQESVTKAFQLVIFWENALGYN